MNERRTFARQKSFMQGRVYFNHRQLSADCTIRDFSAPGARLRFAGSVTLPDDFEILIPSKNEYFKARVVWHKDRDMGITWTPEDMPGPAVGIHGAADPVADRVAKLEHEVAALRKEIEKMQAEAATARRTLAPLGIGASASGFPNS
jgi:hypothetical protein